MGKFGSFAWCTVAVAGDSMSPTLVEGDWLVVSWAAEPAVPKLKALKVYVIERADRPGIHVVKRLMEIGSGENAGKVWVEGDNVASTDSRQWGWIDQTELRARVLFRFKKANSKRSRK
jgi:signal peptidase I